MDEIILRQRDAARPLTGKAFFLNIAVIILKLAIVQMVINLLIVTTGLGLLNIAFYLYAIWLLFGFMRRTVACYVYTLKENVFVLERRLGDSPITVIEIPLKNVVSMRPVKKGERLMTTYRQVTEVDPSCRPSFRVRAAFVLSLLSARLARLCAGGGIGEEIGHVLVYSEAEKLNACVFHPNDEMRAKLAEMLGEAYGFDERMTRARVTTLYARALHRAFPALYPYVEPLVREEDAAWAKDELARRKAQRKQKKAGGKPQTADAKADNAERGAAQTQAAAPKKNRSRKQG